MTGFKLLVVACLLGIALAQQDYQQEYRPAPLRIGTNAAEPKPTPIPILKQINSYRGSRKRCFIMAGNSCKSHSTGNSTRSNYHPKGLHEDAEEQKQQVRKQQQSGEESESVGTGPTGKGFVGGKKFNRKF